MKRSFSLVAATVALVLLGVVSAVAAHGTPTTIHEDSETSNGGDNWTFAGHLSSAKQKCLPDRRVKMYKAKSGNWVFVDKSKSANDGTWETTGHLPGEPPLKFTVTRAKVGSTLCKPDSVTPFGGLNGS
jgi:hypothetical protein